MDCVLSNVFNHDSEEHTSNLLTISDGSGLVFMITHVMVT